MKARPIIYSAPMALAKLAGTKTVTRRPIALREFQRSKTPGYDFAFRDREGRWHDVRLRDVLSPPRSNFPGRCPFGVAGDLLWGREAWRVGDQWDALPPRDLQRDACVRYEADGARSREDTGPAWWAGRYRHARFMPRWASRILDEVVSVRAERLHEITDEDVGREGVVWAADAGLFDGCEPIGSGGGWSLRGRGITTLPRELFAWGWDGIYGAGSWASNPWVWRVETRPAEAP